MATPVYARSNRQGCSTCFLGADVDEPRELTGSVGLNGENRIPDVKNVQSRLNRVAVSDGGPEVPLAVDGISGPLTRAAILHFQKHFKGDLISDGRIDRNKNTWKKLFKLTDVSHSFAEKVPGANAAIGAATTPAVDATLPLMALGLARFRVFEAIKALDLAAQELKGCQSRSFMDLNQDKAFLRAYNELKGGLKELPTVDRVFHVVAGSNPTFTKANDSIRRLRKIYTDMLDMTVRTLITTENAEKNGSRRFVRLVPQSVLNAVHPHGAIADAPERGWRFKNANLGHIRIGSAHLNDSDLITTIIHEMSHFVGDSTSYIVGDHVSGIYNAALNDNHVQSVRNAFCYEWYAMLASFKSKRPTPNASLTLI